MRSSRTVFGSAIFLYFVIGLEVLIMISPFAAFFYAAFNPILLFLARWTATRWLAAFFLPHMVLPPGNFLKAVRVAGSVLFVGGVVVFLTCAVQVYFHKLFRHDPALGGLYRWIRHPQYLALAFTGLGLAILWPRFLTIVLWTVMVSLYYFLAKDEERRMVNQFGERYLEYSNRTGMFLPRGIERGANQFLFPQKPAVHALLWLGLVAVVVIGGAFALRAHTIAQLPLWSQGRVVALTILPSDGVMLEHRMADVLHLPELRSQMDRSPGPILVYLVPRQYIMQGMIADTGPQWRLFQHHGTLPMILDWIFHPFRHLQGGHLMMQHHTTQASPGEALAGGMVRRLIFLQVGPASARPTRASLFSFNAERRPLFYVDVDMHNLVVVDSKELGPGTGWGRVPTPMF